MSRNYNCHAVACQCPWCLELNIATFGEEDILLIDTKQTRKTCKGKEVVITDAQIDRWLKT
jgi:phage FluMu protein Com